jgi:hypothetical protein
MNTPPVGEPADSIGDTNGTVTPRATIGPHDDGSPGEWVQRSVADIGTGIDGEHLSR